MGALAYADMALAFSLVSHNNLAGAIAKKAPIIIAIDTWARCSTVLHSARFS